LDTVFVILVISFATFASLCISCFVQVSAKSVISSLKLCKMESASPLPTSDIAIDIDLPVGILLLLGKIHMLSALMNQVALD
jgi:hypothetical protein